MTRPLVYFREGEGDRPVEVCVIRHGEDYTVQPLTLAEAIAKLAQFTQVIATAHAKEKQSCSSRTSSRSTPRAPD